MWCILYSTGNVQLLVKMDSEMFLQGVHNKNNWFQVCCTVKFRMQDYKLVQWRYYYCSACCLPQQQAERPEANSEHQ